MEERIYLYLVNCLISMNTSLSTIKQSRPIYATECFFKKMHRPAFHPTSRNRFQGHATKYRFMFNNAVIWKIAIPAILSRDRPNNEVLIKCPLHDEDSN